MSLFGTMGVASAIWDLVSGLPSPQRERWPIVVLQAFIDDSGEGDDERADPVFVLAGFIADSTQWAAFSDEWKAALDTSPSIEYFKMREAANLSVDGQFARRLGWDEALRDEKVRQLAAIIPKHAMARIACTVDKAAFKTYAQSLAVLNRSSVIDKPYSIAFQHIILGAAAVFLTYKIQQSCDFIFDEHGKVGQEAVELWDGLKILCQRFAELGANEFPALHGATANIQG